MCYILPKDVKNTLKKMSGFYNDMTTVFDSYGFKFDENAGRRNIVMSHAQEKMLASEIRDSFDSVISDGRTGQPDIVITDNDITRELECKITTPRKSLSLQTDYETLQRKGSLDYIYFITDESFKEFAVLFFEGLTADDFRPPSPGSRGKSSMIKYKAFSKCTPLHGSYNDLRELNIKKCQNKLGKLKSSQQYEKKKIEKSLNFWLNSNKRFTVNLERI